MKSRIIFGITVLISLLLWACSGLEEVSQETINGRRVDYVAHKNGSPTIVFETGMGQTSKTWNPILDPVKEMGSVFLYNRPGYGASSFSNAPQSVVAVAEELNENLIATGQKPPYILVGHSLGGVFINMYARLFPENVVGVIFIDSSHPEQQEYFRRHQPLLHNILMKSASKGKRSYEASILENMSDDFLSAPPFPNVPVTVLTAGKKSSFMESNEMRERMLEFQADLTTLSSNSKQLIVKGSGHFIHKNTPELVVTEIEKMISNSTKQ